jgi:hypothetical protein
VPALFNGRIQTPEASDGLIHEVAHIVFAAHVGTDELGFGAESAQLNG